MRPELLLMAAGVLAVVFVVVKLLYKADSAVEDRRRAAGKIAGVLHSNGCVILPALLEDYMVGDYSGLAIRLGKIATVLTHNPNAIQEEFDKAYERILAAQLADPVKKAALVARVNAANAPAKATPAS